MLQINSQRDCGYIFFPDNCLNSSFGKYNWVIRSWKGHGSLSPVNKRQVPSEEKEQINHQGNAQCIFGSKLSLCLVFKKIHHVKKNIKNRNIPSIQATTGDACVYHSSPMPIAWGSRRFFLLSFCLISPNFTSPSSVDFKTHYNKYKYVGYIRTVKSQFTSSPTLSAPAEYTSNEAIQ